MCIYVGVSSIPIETNQIDGKEIDEGSSNNVASGLTNEIPLVMKEESIDLTDTEVALKEKKPQESADEENTKTDFDEEKMTTETPTTFAPKIKLRIIGVPMTFYSGSIPQQLCQHRVPSNCGCMSNYLYNPIQMMQTYTGGYRSPFSSPIYRSGYPFMSPAYTRPYSYSYSYPAYARYV